MNRWLNTYQTKTTLQELSAYLQVVIQSTKHFAIWLEIFQTSKLLEEERTNRTQVEYQTTTIKSQMLAQ